MHTPADIRQQNQPTVSSDRVSLCIKEILHYGAAGADTPSRTVSFVCQTTPHFGSTLREVSYSVPMYHTRNTPKSKYLFYFLGKFCRFASGDFRNLLIMMK